MWCAGVKCVIKRYGVLGTGKRCKKNWDMKVGQQMKGEELGGWEWRVKKTDCWKWKLYGGKSRDKRREREFSRIRKDGNQMRGRKKRGKDNNSNRQTDRHNPFLLYSSSGVSFSTFFFLLSSLGRALLIPVTFSVAGQRRPTPASPTWECRFNDLVKQRYGRTIQTDALDCM